MKKIVTFALLGFLLIGCNNPSKGPSESESTSSCLPVRYGDKVYYFPCTQRYFGTALNEFLMNDTTRKVAAITGDSRGAYGTNRGYFVVIE
jgi:uncharacterized lipoprotein NlpE involved in copper resistance